MLNPNIEDLLIINHDSKEVHIGSGITGSCNLEQMGKAKHAIEIVNKGSSVESAARRAVSKGYLICKHCIEHSGLPKDICLAGYL